MYTKSKNILKDVKILLISCLLLPALTKSFYVERKSMPSNEMDETSVQISTQQNGVFYYFAYGSNMLTKRIHVGTPTAVKLGAALLKDYRIDFDKRNIIWGGASATIVPEKNASTYGVLWAVDLDQMENLDIQEAVPIIYTFLTVPVTLLSNGTVYSARTYRLTEKMPLDPKVTDFRPTKSYLACIVKGAEEAGLPKSYIRWLKHFNHTDQVDIDFEKRLELTQVELDNWATEEEENA